jgi:endonuclease VIII
MPEGDTIHRLADQLGPVLAGHAVERVTTQGIDRDLAGTTITAVTAVGKHLIIDLDDATRIRTHLGMYGRVRAYRRPDGDALVARMSPGNASLVLVTDDAVCLWSRAKTIEIAARRAPMRDQVLAALGPDILGDAFDPEVAADRAAADPARRIIDVLLDQHVVAGIGNIWKSESLFDCGVDPHARTADVDRSNLVALYASARRLMQARTDRRVYGRTRQPCPQCATPIVCESLGDPPRWTWSCPRCQRGGTSR